MIRRPPGSTLFPYTFFFFNDTATTEIYTLSLHDALPISAGSTPPPSPRTPWRHSPRASRRGRRSEEHTSELQSQSNLVCRLLLEKKKRNIIHPTFPPCRLLRWLHRPTSRAPPLTIIQALA